MAAGKIRRLEELGADAWPAETTERLHGWRLGFTGGVTRRANSVLPNRWDGRVGLDAAVAEVEGRYRGRGLRPCFKMTAASLPPDLGARLDARGYRPEGSTDVFTAETAAVFTAVCAAGADPRGVVLAARPSAAWMATGWQRRDRRTEQPVLRSLVGRIAAPHVFALAERDGQAAGTGLAVLGDGWVGITAVYTLPAFRGGGVALAVVAALAGWAGRRGAPSMYLQVEADNRPAQRLYRAWGFRPAYRYHYLAV